MIVDIIALIFTCTVIPSLCVGFMIYTMISQFRLEKRIDQMRAEKKNMRDELDSVRTRLRAVEIEEKARKEVQQSGAEESNGPARDANQEAEL